MSFKKKLLTVSVSVVLLANMGGLIFAGYKYSWGPFSKFGNVRVCKIPGNQAEYDSSNVEFLAGTPLEKKNVLFLGSSVTFGAASMQDGIPEYFSQRTGCISTKEAVSGTTLVDNGSSSYVSRLRNNVDIDVDYSLVVCQLSTNDATKKLPLGEVCASEKPEDFDTDTITGAMEYIICYSRQNWGCPVVFYTGSRYDSAEYEAMVVRLYELSDKWNIGILDLWSSDEFNSISDEERTLYMSDPIHPTKAGYMKWWCPEMEEQLFGYLDAALFRE